MLELSTTATAGEIRRAYRELSKRYHPDTTELPSDVAREKFQQLKEAYATLSDPQQRQLYDFQLRLNRGRSYRYAVMPPSTVKRADAKSQSFRSSAAYIDPTDRPLSAGELFALFILGLTLVGCLLLAIAIGLMRGDAAFQPMGLDTAPNPGESVDAQIESNVNPFARSDRHLGTPDELGESIPQIIPNSR
ncbi:J domain-containing protein [Phormidium sp. CCY1219]|uniref:J domain-containing protein n=1 Tax=Phormidium sp. CCY1219 TaxID=2886104 RepID=UPI002D1F8558|nr:J domain-containing protein [Phormidium sp. CCY1219]MEB3829650.1 J domain-containing protein [Phormidium sp. CCY1219]